MTLCKFCLTFCILNFSNSVRFLLAFDLIFVCFLHLLSAQLDILSDAFTTIRKRCLKKLEMDSEKQCFYDDQCRELEEEMYREVTHCNQHLNLLIEYV